MRDLQPLIASLLPELVELRHDLHRHSELGYEEHETAARIVSQLQDVPGIELRTGVAGTSVVATLGAERAGACDALRADMDALPIEELGDHAHRSTVPGKMHACGHDGHVTCLVGAARVLAQLGDELEGPVKFLFQPAEEGGAGGRRMCEEGVLAIRRCAPFSVCTAGQVSPRARSASARGRCWPVPIACGSRCTAPAPTPRLPPCCPPC